MQQSINLDFNAFVRFMKRAGDHIIKWYGPKSNYDPCRMSFFAAREWDGLHISEKQYFIKAQKIQDGSMQEDASPYLYYMLLLRYNKIPELENSKLKEPLFDRKFQHIYSQHWKSLPKSERSKYSNLRISDLGATHVIEKRDKLHQMFDSRILNIYELLLKNKPYPTSSELIWFMKIENVNIEKCNKKWKELSQDQKNFYKFCLQLDRSRLKYQRSAWLTKLLMVDFESDNFTASDFELPEARIDLESIVSIFASRPEQRPVIQLKRPLSPYNLWIGAYRELTREERPEFKFGPHLKYAGEAWHKLTDEEKQVYYDQAKKMREEYEEQKAYLNKGLDELSKIHLNLFRHSKSYNGPSKPSHLTKRLPSVTQLFGSMNKIRRAEVKARWESLDEEEKEVYYRELQKIKDEKSKAQEEIKLKLEYIEGLLKEANELQKTKRDLRLIGTRYRTKNRLFDI